MQVERINPETMFRNPAYSQMVVLPPGARTAIIGGQNALDKDGKVVGRGDIARQTEQALKNLVTCLAAAGAGLEDLVQMRIYILAGQNLRSAFGAWMKLWGARSNPPAVTGIFVAGLANPDYLIEIEGLAVLPG